MKAVQKNCFKGYILNLLLIAWLQSIKGLIRVIWPLDHSGVFCTNIFFNLLNKATLNLDKVISFIWTAVPNIIIINDMLQVCMANKTLSPYVCVMCGTCSKSDQHLFLHYSTAVSLWNPLVSLFVHDVCPLGPWTTLWWLALGVPVEVTRLNLSANMQHMLHFHAYGWHEPLVSLRWFL